MVTYELFKEAMLRLCVNQESYDSRDLPANVSRILFPTTRHLKDANTVFEYFKVKKGTNTYVSGEWSLPIIWKNETTMLEYVRFVRSYRDKFFPNKYKKHNNKFISRLN